MERPETTAAFMARHQAHDYEALISQWKELSASLGLHMKNYARLGDFDLYYVETPVSGQKNASYISAGMHGDEAAPPWALLEWTRNNLSRFQSEPFLFFPCLNPWGFVNNVRTDERGRDMNRLFHDGTAEGIREWRDVVGERRLRICINLHEDYDAQGMYVYELNPETRRAEAVLQAAGKVIPPDMRAEIDDSDAEKGVIRRKVTPDTLPPLPGLPEAIYLHFHHSDASLTIESPSEFALCDRIDAHVLGLSAALDY